MNLDTLVSLFDKNNIDGYIIPHTDEYQNEYISEHCNRLKFISRFTGSNGVALITKKQKFFWTDGRYTIQAKKEVPDFIMSSRDFKEVGQAKIGYNPMLFTKAQLDILSKDLEMLPIEQDLIDQIWDSKPLSQISPAYLYPLKYAGRSCEEKLALVRANFTTLAEYTLITDPDSICWLLNIRGHDIPNVPVLLCYMVLGREKAHVFTDITKIPQEIRTELPYVEFQDTQAIYPFLQSIQDTILIDPTACSVGLSNLCKNKIIGRNPCLVPKACKHASEIQYAISGHIKDAIALCEGLAWVHKNRGITEHEVSTKLTELRSQQEGYVGDSFPTIAGFRENGASIHYRAPEIASKIIEGDGILLVDSGAHYWGCTTDVTRVLIWGKPTKEQKRRYTQVLKGHLALAASRVPEGTFGGTLDSRARQYLWEDGVDYVHGTGHGVGSMLNVHEYPRYVWSPQALTELKAGMILSNEPGFYKEGEFGIRIENLLYVRESKYQKFLEFEMLTLVPYARDLIDIEMLTAPEKDYLKNYYSRIEELVLPSLSEAARIWCQYEMELLHQPPFL